MRIVVSLSLQSMLKQLILVIKARIFALGLQSKVILCKGTIHLNEMFPINLHSFLILLDDLHNVTICGQRIGPIDGADDDLFDGVGQHGHLVLEELVSYGC